MFQHRIPKYIRRCYGPEFIARALTEWLEHVGVQTLFIKLGSPWENGYNESFKGKLRDELLNSEANCWTQKHFTRWRRHRYWSRTGANTTT